MSYKIINQENKRNNYENELQIFQFNCNGINKKLSEIKLYIYTKKPDIICLNETWLSNLNRKPNFIGYASEWSMEKLT